MNKFRNLLYRLASLLGDVNAVNKGKVGQRVVRKSVFKTSGSLINKIVKW